MTFFDKNDGLRWWCQPNYVTTTGYASFWHGIFIYCFHCVVLTLLDKTSSSKHKHKGIICYPYDIFVWKKNWPELSVSMLLFHPGRWLSHRKHHSEPNLMQYLSYFLGTDCEYHDECSTEPCENGGTCSDTDLEDHSSAVCTCVEGNIVDHDSSCK